MLCSDLSVASKQASTQLSQTNRVTALDRASVIAAE
ncbi:hypothetical protein Gdia_2494 [Gluconacetobacter diazotrophicus PA1 5]|nr:hypothetical protein Gdia_2494 [Gluconacetobacter diazotrophicus PA1 5]